MQGAANHMNIFMYFTTFPNSAPAKKDITII